MNHDSDDCQVKAKFDGISSASIMSKKGSYSSTQISEMKDVEDSGSMNPN